MNIESGARFSMSQGGTTQDFGLVFVDGPVHADLSDEPGFYAGVPHAPGNIFDERFGDCFFGQAFYVKRMECRRVEAGSHDDMNARGPGYASQGFGVAAIAVGCQLDHCSAAGILEPF
jgi:hypothetical protein